MQAWASGRLVFHMMYSAYKLNKQGDNIQLGCTPFPILNQSIVPCPVLNVVSWPAYRFLCTYIYSYTYIFICIYIYNWITAIYLKHNIVNQPYFKKKREKPRTSSMVQWLRIHLAVQGTPAWSLVQEDLTCLRATEPVLWSLRVTTTEPTCCNSWKLLHPETHEPRQEKR